MAKLYEKRIDWQRIYHKYRRSKTKTRSHILDEPCDLKRITKGERYVVPSLGVSLRTKFRLKQTNGKKQNQGLWRQILLPIVGRH